MVERVARAIYEAAPESERRLTWEECCEQVLGYADAVRKDARAAIGAMREPTQEMILNGYACRSACHIDQCKTPVECMWREMIDAAIREEKDEKE